MGGEGFAFIKGNRFYKNRHDVGSSGISNSGYEVSFNYFEGEGTHDNVDCHGQSDTTGGEIAGKFMYIHDNIFEQTEWESLEGKPIEKHNIIIRGIPEYMVLIENNKFRHTDVNSLLNTLGYRENIFAWNNIYDWNGSIGNYKGFYMSKNWKDLQSNNTYLPLLDDHLMTYQLGDFDGDGKTEIFKTIRGAWYVAEIPTPNNYSGYKTWEWEKINTSGKLVEQLGFGDFNGDGTTDVFNANGSDWYISYGGNSGWELLNTNTTTTLNRLRFGDFNGDGTTDVFKANSEGWHVSYGGSTVWDRINTSGKSVEQLGFGDFNSDGTTDVFNANGQDWYVSYGGNSDWTHFRASGETIDKLFFGTLNSQGAIGEDTNVFVKNHQYYQIAESPDYTWKPLTSQ